MICQRCQRSCWVDAGRIMVDVIYEPETYAFYPGQCKADRRVYYLQPPCPMRARLIHEQTYDEIVR